MIYKCANAYYFRYLNKIGGIESHLYYISRKYCNKYEIAVFYKDGDSIQIARLKKYVRCIKIDDNDKVVCDKVFCCFNREILNQCEANEKILVLHGDYKAMIEKGQLSKELLPIDSRIDRYIGVSELVCENFTEITGIKTTNVYQPVELDDVEKPLMLVSATRLTKEKGWERMVKLANTLDEANINYLWFIFTDSNKEPTKNMVFVKPRLDISNKVGGFDAFVQLSDNEGYCLSIVEALARNVPIICTNLPVLKELNVNQTNSIKLPFKMDDIPIEKIKNIRDMKFTYKILSDKWENILSKEKTTQQTYHVKATTNYKKYNIIDSQLGRKPKLNETWYIDQNRYDELMKYQEQKHIKLIEVI